MKFKPFVAKHAREIGMVFLILVLALGIRLFLLPPMPDYTPSDMQRDVLISSHIVSYHELPLRGPDGFLEGLLPSSPVYYYLLAGVLFINNSITAVTVLNILFQLAFLISVYLLARALFDRATALVSLLIVSFSYGFVEYSLTTWQPTIGQPVLFIGYLLLYRGYTEKKLSATLSGVGLFFLSLALAPSSVLSISPTIALLAVLSVVRVERPQKGFVLLLLISFVLFVILFVLPFALRVTADPSLAATWNTGMLTQLGAAMFQLDTVRALWERTLIFAQFFLPFPRLLLGMAFCGAILYHMYEARGTRNRRNWTVLLLGTLQVILLAAVVQTYTLPLPERFFIPVFGLFVIWIAHTVVRVSRALVPAAAILPFILTIGYLFLALPHYHVKRTTPKTYPFMNALTSEIRNIRTRDKRNDYHFFAFRMYEETENAQFEEDEFTEIPLWIQLEQHLATKLVAVEDKKLWGYVRIGDSEAPYVFLVCSSYEQQERHEGLSRCPAVFLLNSPQYQLIKTVFESPYEGVYLFAHSPSSFFWKNGLL